jgi:hypothetical protein
MCQESDRHVAIMERDRKPPGLSPLPEAARPVITRLLQAHDYAIETGRDVWEFAVSIVEFRRAGVAESVLRWLICRGYVDHAKEVSVRSSTEREFISFANLRFSAQTAFVLTETGVTLGRELSGFQALCDDLFQGERSSADRFSRTNNSQVAEDERAKSHDEVLPKWDRDRRELRVGDRLVKVFKLPSPMQETILMAFEEEGWPPRIDDPLPMHPELMPKRRLHDTIKSLNRNQKSGAIRFMGDGTGEGVRWELVTVDQPTVHLKHHSE